MVLDESKLCCNGETCFKQAFSYEIHHSSRRNHLVFSYYGGIEKEQVQNLQGFRKLNVAMKKDPYYLPFSKEVLDMVVGHEVHSFLDGFSCYHQIMIALEDRNKIVFIIDWGTFV
jgi:hypothetical protein